MVCVLYYFVFVYQHNLSMATKIIFSIKRYPNNIKEKDIASPEGLILSVLSVKNTGKLKAVVKCYKLI